MKFYNYNKLNKTEVKKLFTRPAQNNLKIEKQVQKIITDVKINGHIAVLKYAKKYDGLNSNSILVSQDEIFEQAKKIDKNLKNAIDKAYRNIVKFHIPQIPTNYKVETIDGVLCRKKYLPIENVGLYIPGGSAVLFSTLLMLGTPAKLAGCKRIVVCTPIKNYFHPALAYVAKKVGVHEFYNVGGAHAIAMLAYGTKEVKKVDKIFGPGNQFVTLAKSIVSSDSTGCLIDMLAGPSEVLVIADKYANPIYIASDLLSQAEHGYDSQVILLTDDDKLAEQVLYEIENQLKMLDRKSIAEKCLQNSSIIIVKNFDQAIMLSNEYAPEHLIMNIKNYKEYINKIVNAGSVFLGKYSPESVGDYASGTNHSLPTYGYAKSIGGVGIDSFMKSISFQSLTKNGIKNIASTVITMAEAEGLQAHANAVKVRVKNGN